ncbi:hypothetical protein IK110_00470 [Candidatus Saccharibacteria bacterium]|nr:hypothetical protein [Candidatus Saccharibacteria bacterium]
MRFAKVTMGAAVTLFTVIVLACILSSPRLFGVAWASENQGGPTPTPTPIPENEWVPFETIHYYTYDKKDREYYFGPNAHDEAEAAITSGKVDTELAYYVNFDNYVYNPEVDPATLELGDLLYRAKFDPALCASLAADVDFRGVSGAVKILTREVDMMENYRGAVVDHAHEEFLKDHDYWRTAWNRLLTIYTSEESTWEVVQFEDYTSTMYMVKDGLRTGVPAVIVSDTENKGGWFLKFTLRTEKDGEFISIYYRLNCGYQPIDPPGWNPPGTTPTPTPTPPVDTPTPTPTSTPTPTPTSTPTPTPAPKDPQNDPQNRVDPTEPGADDFYSPDGGNNDPITTQTPEPTSPSSYTPPSPPVATATPTPVPTSTPAPTATPTPAPTSAPTNTPTPTPVTGNSQSGNWKPLDDVANNNPAHPVTNEPNSGDIAPPE